MVEVYLLENSFYSRSWPAGTGHLKMGLNKIATPFLLYAGCTVFYRYVHFRHSTYAV
jgi:hypothetical protein